MAKELYDWQDRLLLNALDDVVAERRRQDAIFGEQNHSPLEWLGILDEEHGEMAKEALRLCAPEKNDPSGEYDLPIETLKALYRKELIQMVAVGVAMIESFDRGKWSLSNDIERDKLSAKAQEILRRYEDNMYNALSDTEWSRLKDGWETLRDAFVQMQLIEPEIPDEWEDELYP